MARTRRKNWISSAIKRPGALTAKARRAGAVTSRGTIDSNWLRQQAKASGRTGRQARLALQLRKMRKKRR